MSDRKIPARVGAFDAAVRRAIEEANDNSWSYRGNSFRTGEVVELADQDVSESTARRALKDAAALGWVRNKGNKWKPGHRAKSYVPSDDLDALEDALEDAVQSQP